MATLTKSRSKKVLAEGNFMLSRGASFQDAKPKISIALRSDEETSQGNGTWYTISMPVDEAQNMINRLQKLITNGIGS